MDRWRAVTFDSSRVDDDANYDNDDYLDDDNDDYLDDDDFDDGDGDANITMMTLIISIFIINS